MSFSVSAFGFVSHATHMPCICLQHCHPHCSYQSPLPILRNLQQERSSSSFVLLAGTIRAMPPSMP
jgi:hypothetical protein